MKISLLVDINIVKFVDLRFITIQVWFFDGSVTCYQGAHLALAIVAALFLILAGLFIPVSIGIVCQKELSEKVGSLVITVYIIMRLNAQLAATATLQMKDSGS